MFYVGPPPLKHFFPSLITLVDSLPSSSSLLSSLPSSVPCRLPPGPPRSFMDVLPDPHPLSWNRSPHRLLFTLVQSQSFLSPFFCMKLHSITVDCLLSLLRTLFSRSVLDPFHPSTRRVSGGKGTSTFFAVSFPSPRSLRRPAPTPPSHTDPSPSTFPRHTKNSQSSSTEQTRSHPERCFFLRLKT